MIKTLQKKFIITAMTAITILLVVLLGAINAVNAWTTARETDGMLEFLSNTRFMQGMQGMQSQNRYNNLRGFMGRTFTEDDAMSAVYFVVHFDNTGEIERVDVSRISSVDEDEAKSLAIRAYNEDESGVIDKFKYVSISNGFSGGKTYFFLDTSTDYLSIARVIGLSLIIGIVCWVLMLLLVILLSRRAIRPIAENMQKQRQFVTDAGHEIKTPLAIILANTDAMELHNGESKWSKNIRNQANRLDGLMQNLLTLARADEDKKVVNTEDFDLSALLEDSVLVFEESMRMKNLSLRKNISENAMIHANKEQVSRLLSILMDNAVKYSEPDSMVEISLTSGDKKTEFYIENQCDTLPQCEPASLFDRFYRADTARTQKNGGYGIGLSAAKAIVEGFGGEITAQYLSQNKIRFTVRF